LRVVREKFEKYNGYIDKCPLYFIALVLNPRIKGSLIQLEYPNGDIKLADICKTLHKLYIADKAITQLEYSSSLNKTWESRLLSKVYKTTAPVSNIDRYFDSPVVDWDGGDDPHWILKWWKANTTIYPLMSQVARDYLAIQAAEVDVERLFSESRNLIGLRRHSIAPETMKAILFLRNEYRRHYRL
jgi:hypothetical protein